MEQRPEGVGFPDHQRPSREFPPEIAKLVSQWRDRIVSARDGYWNPVFTKMRRNAHWATWGCEPDWVAAKQARVNLLGRHLAIKAAQLYAKDPAVKIRPTEMIEGVLWDGDASSLSSAQVRIQQAMMAGMEPSPLDVAMLAEAQQILQERALRERVAKTLELLVGRFIDHDFKVGMKSAVMRALVCGVAWVRYDVIRGGVFNGRIQQAELETGPFTSRERAAMVGAAATILGNESDKLAEDDPRRIELTARIEAPYLPKAPVEERVVWSFPDPTAIIIDPACKSLVGLEGASWAVQESFLDREEVLAIYGVDVGADARRYSTERGMLVSWSAKNREDDGSICVWHIYDRRSGSEMAIADGYSGWLIPPRQPDVYRERFWPWEALILNGIELPPGVIYPPSEVDALIEIQDDINNSKQALREHRRAHRPLWVCETGALSAEEVSNLVNRPPFSVIPLRILGQKRVVDVLQQVPLQPVDPAIYETAGYERDVMLVGGTQAVDMGGASGEATATEVAVAQGARSVEISEERDQLEDGLTRIVSRLVETLLIEMSTETVQRLVGKGAAWPELDPFSVRAWIDVKIRAGSTGRPNRELEVAAFERIAPLLVQIPGINPTWLAEQILERIVPDVDLSEAISGEAPSITAANAMVQKAAEAPVAGPAPDNRPESQGSEGSLNVDKNGVPRPRPTDIAPAGMPEQMQPLT